MYALLRGCQACRSFRCVGFNLQHPKSQLAWLSGKTGFKCPSVIDNNPFDILGIPKGSSYENVKRKFVEPAMKHHPDVSESDDDDVEEFVRLRQAFETIRESEDETARLTKDGETDWSGSKAHKRWRN
jgi:DnaJ-class molecular chaperone